MSDFDDSGRLTDERVAEIVHGAREYGGAWVSDGVNECDLASLGLEIQQRRAADLSPDELEAVRGLLQYATPYFLRRSDAARSALDKILNAQ